MLLPTVWPDKYVNGIRSIAGPHIDKQGRIFEPLTGDRKPLKEALEYAYTTDAHMTCYAMKDEASGESCDIPLLRKGIERELKNNGIGLYTVAVCFDWDTPGHIPLTDDLFEGFLNKLKKVENADHRLATWMCLYTTRCGARLIYELSLPVEVTDAEKKLITMIHTFMELGLEIDTSCKDWTRRFRLPKVMRDNIPTWEEPCFHIEFKDRKLDLHAFKRATSTMTLAAKTYRRPEKMPTLEQSRKELKVMGTQGRDNQSYFYKEAKKVINNSHFAKDILDPAVPLLGDTGRNDKIGLMLGQLVPLLIRKVDARVEQIFAVFHEKLTDLEVVPGRIDPISHFWEYLVNVYDKEWGKRQAELENEVRKEEDCGNRLLAMAKGMRVWCDAPELNADDQETIIEFVKGRLFAFADKKFFPMDDDGWYSDSCLDREQLIPYIRKGHMNDMIDTVRENQRGDNTSINPSEIINNHSVIAYDICASPLQGSRGRIDGMGTMRPVLWLPMYQRNDRLSPKYDATVDGWLKALFGEYYETGCKWLGYALRFEDGPICALSLTGASGVGKKMIYIGLSECLERPEFATGTDLTGEGTGMLMKTPFLVCNEGLPKFGKADPSDTFKQLTAGDPITVRELYKPAINVTNPVRIILTANDTEMHRDMLKGKAITPETRKAIGERLMHIPVGPEAEQYLISIGGREHTEKEGHRWIRGDSGQPSDFVVARHFLWLMEHRPPRNMKDRYCVMGNCGANSTFSMSARTELQSMVTRACIDMIEGKSPKYSQKIFVSQAGRVYISPVNVIDMLREKPSTGTNVTEPGVLSALSSIQRSSSKFDVKGVQMVEIDLNELLKYAGTIGLGCPKVREYFSRVRGSVV